MGQNKKPFKVGDLVRVNSVHLMSNGKTGIVLEIDPLFKTAEVYIQVTMKTVPYYFSDLVLEE